MPEKEQIAKKHISGKSAMILIFASGLVLGGGGMYLINALGNKPVNKITAQNDVQYLDSVDLDTDNNVIYIPDTSVAYPDTIPDSVAYAQIWNSLIAEPGYREMDSLFLDSIVKRIYADSVMQIHRGQYEIYLQNEELLSAKYINVEVFAQVDDSTNTYKVSLTDRYYVEFWKSPINFEGYVKNGKSLKLYSVQPGEAISFVKIGTKLYMRRKGQWFSLLESAEEQSFSKVKDVSTLEILAEVKQ